MALLAERYQEGMYALIDEVLREIGPRESCSESEKKLGQKLLDRGQGLGLDTRRETFTCNPKAFLGFIPFASLLYLAATVSYWFAPLLCFLFASAAMALTFFELLRYREFIDPLFPAAEGERERGWPIREHMIPLGASDATAFSNAGIPSVALLCQDATRLVDNYHTRLDTIDRVRPQSLSTMLQMVLDMVQHIDRNDGF